MDPSRMTATIHRRSGKPISFRLETGKKEKDASPLMGCHSCTGLPDPRPPGPPATPGEHSQLFRLAAFTFLASV